MNDPLSTAAGGADGIRIKGANGKMSIFADLRGYVDVPPLRNEPAVVLGLLCTFMGQFPSHAQAQVGYAVQLIHAALAADQLKVYFDRFGKVEGYVIHAALDEALYRQYLAGAVPPLDAAALRSGAHACVLDFLAVGTAVPAILKDLKRYQIGQGRDLTYYRVKGKRLIFKRAEFACRSALLHRV